MAKDRTFEAIAIRAVDATNVTDSYTNLGVALTSPLYIMTLKNTSDVIMFISEDASTDHYELAPGDVEPIDLNCNRVGSIGAKRVGLQFSVKLKGVPATAGRVILQGQTL